MQKSRPVTRDRGAPVIDVIESRKLRHTRHRWRIVEADADNAEASCLASVTTWAFAFTVQPRGAGGFPARGGARQRRTLGERHASG